MTPEQLIKEMEENSILTSKEINELELFNGIIGTIVCLVIIGLWYSMGEVVPVLIFSFLPILPISISIDAYKKIKNEK